ncbi:hypothetical protein Thiowin_03990 [Thiorhodovibrio winogradskyi]|uniref:PIN domain-containing protein n=1 Tax=Thiorhodovibrio winogradskyi TaxID=77007 RepID=A0ABZ0SF04_9GAMM|nr:PIN domain-containing protein [Thiorhodovibrio winogradskyi]
MRQHPLISRRKGVLIDANLLTVLIVGRLGSGEVEAFKRTRNFTTQDYEQINELVGLFGSKCMTPHVLAEVSNLLDWLEPKRKQYAFSHLAEFAQAQREIFPPAAEIVATPIYFKLGITDAGLFQVAQQQPLVLLTADLPLYHYAAGRKLEAINFNHIREAWV